MGSRIKYRNGFPTKKQMIQIIDEFFGETFDKPRLSSIWGSGATSNLIWTRNNINERIPDFILYLNEYGIYTSTIIKYESPRVGSLSILRKGN